MNSWQQKVQDFHKKFGVPAPDAYTPDNFRSVLRCNLIFEELLELAEALNCELIQEDSIPAQFAYKYFKDGQPHLKPIDGVKAIDAIGDLLVTVLGTAVEMGVDMDPFVDEIHRTNMAKEGGATRGDGKILKPEGWQPPDIAGILSGVTLSD